MQRSRSNNPPSPRLWRVTTPFQPFSRRSQRFGEVGSSPCFRTGHSGEGEVKVLTLSMRTSFRHIVAHCHVCWFTRAWFV